MSYIKKTWPHLSGSSTFLQFVADPFPSSASSTSASASNSNSSKEQEEEQVLRITYPVGSLGGDGGVGGLHLAVFGSGSARGDSGEGRQQGRAVISYRVAFAGLSEGEGEGEGWDWVKGA